jgi:hypothetical protein
MGIVSNIGDFGVAHQSLPLHVVSANVAACFLQLLEKLVGMMF